MYKHFPAIRPYNKQFIAVTAPHKLYVEESGNPEGIPVLFIHGGPGGGTSNTDRCFFDQEKYRIILFDQRGSGLSTPHARLEDNNTIEENLAHILGEIHRLGQSKEVADEMKREGVADGVVPTIIKECKKKANKDKHIFLSQCKGASWEPNDSGITTVFSNWTRTFAGGRNDKRIVYPNVLDKSGDLTTDITPDGSAYTFHGDTNTWTYDAQKDPHVVKRGQLVKLLLTPQFYCTKSGAKGMRFKIGRVKVLKQSPYGEKRSANVDWGNDSDDDLSNYAKRARTDE